MFKLPIKNKDHRAQVTRPQEWVDLYGDFLYRFALGRVHNSEDAQNAVQETFLAALHSRKNFIGKSTERTWLVSILKHKIIDQFRRSYREKTVTDLTDVEEEINTFFDQVGYPLKPPLPWQIDPSQLLENKEFWQIFRQCLQKLPPAIRDAFQFKEVDHVDSPEICRILKITPSNLWVMLYRARLQLRRCLEVNWFEGSKNENVRLSPFKRPKN